MDPERFAHFLADLWDEYLDWYTRVLDTPGDRDVDVVLTDGRVVQVIRAKQYGPGTTIGASEVRDGVSLRETTDEVDTVFVVTTGRFSDEAWRDGSDPDVVLIDIDVLVTLVDDFGAEPLVAAYFDDYRMPGGFDSTTLASLVAARDALRGGVRRRLRSVLERVTDRHDVENTG